MKAFAAPTDLFGHAIESKVRSTMQLIDYVRIFEHSPNAYLVMDLDFHIVGANRAYLTSTNRPLQELVGRRAWDAFPTDPETLQLAIASFERVKRTKLPDTLPLLRFDVPRPLNEGGGMEKRYWSISAIPVLDEAGDVRLLLQHPIDVTELERLKEAKPDKADLDVRAEHDPHFCTGASCSRKQSGTESRKRQSAQPLRSGTKLHGCAFWSGASFRVGQCSL